MKLKKKSGDKIPNIQGLQDSLKRPNWKIQRLAKETETNPKRVETLFGEIVAKIFLNLEKWMSKHKSQLEHQVDTMR